MTAILVLFFFNATPAATAYDDPVAWLMAAGRYI
ncbi:MAG: hypothetical protein BWX88_02757 [Planctomycetes bacterium ADurb.Bin126]|nr:MAG: hypothetical protein BWX88_02757 [Planctomycetes bacterium ADurb.Bin126]